MRGGNGIRPGGSLPPALRATSLAEGGPLAPSARGLRPQAVGGEKFALLLRFRRYDYSFLFVLDWLSGLS